MSKIKRTFTFLLVVTTFISFLGFFISISYYANPNNILPLYNISDIQVDFEGNIYIGVERFRIQVFDKEGNYLYPICFNNLGGAFLFYVNGVNSVDIYSSSDYMQYSFLKEEIITKTKIDTHLGAQTRLLFLSVKNPNKTYRDNEGNGYRIIENEVFVQRNGTDNMVKIQFATPRIPFPPFTHIVIAGICLFSNLLINYKSLNKLFSTIKPSFKQCK